MTTGLRTVHRLSADTVVDDEADSLRLRRKGALLDLTNANAHQREYLSALSDGMDDAKRRHLLSRIAPRERIELQAFGDSLQRNGWTFEQLLSGEHLLASKTLISRWFTPAKADPQQAYALSRYALLRHHEDGLLLESPRCHARIVLQAAALERCSKVLSSSLAAGWDDCGDVGALVSMLVECGFLIPCREDGKTAEDLDQTLDGWEFHDLLFHSRSRAGRHSDPLGKVDPALIDWDKQGAKAGAGGPDRITLPRPAAPLPSVLSFGEVLESRRSVREPPAEPLTCDVLADFLYHSARIEPANAPGPAGSHRPFASAGGLDEIELVLNVLNCQGLEPGLYRYDAIAHALDPIAQNNDSGQLLARFCGAEPIGVHIITTARFSRMNSRYNSLAYSLTLRNAGCLLQTMYLVATALGRAPCASGAGDADYFARVTGLPYEVEGSISDFVLR